MLALTRDDCVELLASGSFGRLALGTDPPVIRPVNYRFDEPSQSVVFRTNRGSKLHALLRAGKAAFEIDGADPTARCGWSVIVLGVAEEISTPSEIRRLERLGPEPWAPGPKPHWMRIRARTVTGRRIVIGAEPDRIELA
jgi:nitroimidazol reductase NimA-like FMN-containing flavoprotein (pyridoxamine 5'-phosphate oxidase superfamily)